MTTNRSHFYRKSLRLSGHDYSRARYYFITICIQNRWQRIFGNVLSGKMDHSEYGEIVLDEWNKTAILRPYVALDEFSVMPDHLRGIIRLTECLATACRGPEKTVEKFGKPTIGTIPTIVRAFKSAISKRIHKINPEFQWHSNYYEHIIRDDKSLYFIRKYIRENPLKWHLNHEKHIDKEIADFEMKEIKIDR